MEQYQAGYILDAVQRTLHAFEGESNPDIEYQKRSRKIQGLLGQLSTFDVIRPDQFTKPNQPAAILAVLRNIITRGTPTLPSESLEEIFAERLKFTAVRPDKGALKYPAIRDLDRDSLLCALHLIDPRARHRADYLDLTDTDSGFEQDFLLSLIPEPAGFLTQLLQHQRTRSSLTHDNNPGRVDFSLEVPYFRENNTTDKFKMPINIKCRACYVVEVDGKKYHNLLIDELKDAAISQLPKNISHVKEDTAFADAQQLIAQLLADPYVECIRTNFDDSQWLTNPLTALVLSPFLIARIQIVLLDYLIERQAASDQSPTIRLAVIERDLPAARLAVDDLKRHLFHLNGLAGNLLTIPDIILTVFVTDEFISHPLNGDSPVHLADTCNPADFDLVLDVSVLRRSGIFKTDHRFASNHTWLIRSAHFTHHLTGNPLCCAPCITYLPVTKENENEVHEPIKEQVEHLRYFMRNIFRKEDFRDGQLPIMNRALQLRPVIGLLPTGGGKSLTYQLLSLLQPGITVIIDPIRSLMEDQFRGLRKIGIDRCGYLNSGLPAAEKRYNQNVLLVNGQLQFIFVSPERFVIQEFRDALSMTAAKGFYFAYAVIDEVHCVSEWGHDFRTPYLNLGQNAVKFCKTATRQPIPLYGLTATASFDVLADIERELQIPDSDGKAVVRYENTVRDEISYRIFSVPSNIKGTPGSVADIRKHVGIAKQNATRALLDDKEQLLSVFNTEEATRHFVTYSWDNYLPYAYRTQRNKTWGQQPFNGQETLHRYLASRQKDLLFDSPIFGSAKMERDNPKLDHGIIVFTPHRRGPLGITNGGLYDEQTKIANLTDATSVGDTFGYFMGSGDDLDSKLIEEESSDNMDRFMRNEFSVMVATKAFGMGIDKDNVRLTIHINLPQSIESFVQEAGRAGRDKKLSCSVILYNDETFRLGGLTESDAPIVHVDKDVLTYFHENAFRGKVKERMMIYELRNEVTFPNTTNAQRIANLLNELYGNNKHSFTIRMGGKWKGVGRDWSNHVFVSVDEGVGVGNVSLIEDKVTPYSDFADTATCREILELVKAELPLTGDNMENVAGWLRQTGADTRRHIGIEKMLSEIEETDTKSYYIHVPFTNRFYTPQARFPDTYRLNTYHKDAVKNTDDYQHLLQLGAITEAEFFNAMTLAVKDGKDFGTFVDSLRLTDQTLVKELKNIDRLDWLHLNYYKGRGQEDTAKAIYRLISIGVIENYTIDYQNKIYTLEFRKKRPGAYFDGLQELLARYTSKQQAVNQISKLKEIYHQRSAEGKATELSYCLEQLTEFVYDKIKGKRERAIDDMIGLCREAGACEHDPLEQNKVIKDTIYYYFNAKYSRRDFVEPKTTISPLGEGASLFKDREVNVDIAYTVSKYIRLVEDSQTGQFINNAKHLRGSTMRMLRSFGDEPAYLILKAYALFVLPGNSTALVEEAQRELAKGLSSWKQSQPDLDLVGQISWLRECVAGHVSDNQAVLRWFDDIEDLCYVQYYTHWTTKFASEKLQKP